MKSGHDNKLSTQNNIIWKSVITLGACTIIYMVLYYFKIVILSR